MQRRRVVGRVAEMAERLTQWTEEQGHVLDRLARLAPKTQEVVAKTIEKLRPVIQQAAERIQQRPERVAARQRATRTNAAREELLGLRMQAFEREQRAGRGYIPPGLEAQLADRSQAEDVRQRQMIRALGEPELRRSLRQAKATEHEREAHDRAPSRSRGMGMER
jgi:gas vesicle protein